MITYTSTKVGLLYQMKMRAARLVPTESASALPSPIGDIDLFKIDDPEQYGIPEKNAIQKTYPTMTVQHYAMVLRQEHFVEREGVRGVALYFDWNGSDLGVDITSINGRNALAPFSWEGKPNTEKDPTAANALEWRMVKEGKEKFSWQNHLIHGWPGVDGRDRRLDWFDGVPESVKTMHDREAGRVSQYIMVPQMERGLGVAEQTIPTEYLTKTVCSLIRFPKPEFKSLGDAYRKPIRPVTYYGPDTLETLGSAVGGKKILYRGQPTTKGVSEPDVEETTDLEVEFKVAAGGKIRQHVIFNPFNQCVWDDPEVLLVFWPISYEQYQDRFASSKNIGSGRKTF